MHSHRHQLGGRCTARLPVPTSTIGPSRPRECFRPIIIRATDSYAINSLAAFEGGAWGARIDGYTHRARQRHLGHSKPPYCSPCGTSVDNDISNATVRTSFGRRRCDAGHAEDSRGGSILCNHAARCVGDDSEMLDSGAGAEADVAEDAGVDLALITHGEQRRSSSRRESTVLTERMRRGLTGEISSELKAVLEKARNLLAKSQPTVGENQSTVDITKVLLGFLNQRVIGGG